MFRNREDAAQQLAQRLKHRTLRNPLVLAIPRGGVVLGAVLARELGADLDVVLARKLRAPGQPELAIGAICENGEAFLNEYVKKDIAGMEEEYLAEEYRQQLGEIARRKKLIRAVRPQAPVKGRSVIVTDDGIATGSTMLAALQVLQSKAPHEVIVAVPVVSADRLPEIQRWCNRVVWLRAPRDFRAIGQFYDDFAQVEDEEVLAILEQFAGRSNKNAVAGMAK
jgi:predicted phosphoribosyltransferase